MSFKQDLKIGKQYEDEVVELFNFKFKRPFRKVTKEDDPNLYKCLDIVEEGEGPLEKMITAECKWSGEKHKDSKNVIVEYLTYDNKPSGISSSLATYWVFKVGDFHLMVKRDELLKTIIFDLLHTESHSQIKSYERKGEKILIVPKDLLTNEKLCPSTEVYPMKGIGRWF